MSGSDQELEVKLCLTDLPALKARLESLGARLIQPRTHENNLRFDTPGGDLTRSFQVLRLRQDSAVRITYKGPSDYIEGVRSRREIEFLVGDFEAARALFEALGYQVSVIYEKYRAAYVLEGVEITLDELPYGDFIEIEGPDAKSIHAVAQELVVDWGARIPESYTVLFERLRGVLGFSFRDLTFKNFEDLEVTPETLGVQPADLGIQST